MKFYKIILMLIIILVVFPINIVKADYTEQTNNLNIYSDSVILIDSTTGKILYEKNSKEKLYPASTTKILTAIITLETCDLNSIATVSRSAVLSVPSRIFFCLFIRGRRNECWRAS